MINFIYPARIEADKTGRYMVTFRDLPFAVTDGATLGEALEEATDCLTEALASCITDNENIPLPSTCRKNEYLIAPDALVAAKTALYLAVREQKMNKSSLAVKLGVSEAVGRRLLDPRYHTKLVNINNALHVMGKKMVISVS